MSLDVVVFEEEVDLECKAGLRKVFKKKWIQLVATMSPTSQFRSATFSIYDITKSTEGFKPDIQFSKRNYKFLSQTHSFSLLDVRYKTPDHGFVALIVNNSEYRFKTVFTQQWVRSLRAVGVRAAPSKAVSSSSLFESVFGGSLKKEADIGGLIDSFDRRPIHEWTEEDTQEWLLHTPVHFNANLITRGIGYCFKRHKVNGKRLLQLTKQNLLEMGISIIGFHDVLTFRDKLMARGAASLNLHRMVSKFANNSLFMKEYDNEFDKLSSYSILELCDEESTKRTFLPLDHVETMDGQDGSKLYRLRMKLVLTDIDSNMDALASFLFRKVSEKLPEDYTSNYFGLVHSALIVGPWELEWGNLEYVTVKGASTKQRTMSSNRAILAADLSHEIICSSLAELEAVRTKITKHIVEWSVHYKYRKPSISSLAFGKSNTGNCQDFVMSLLSSLIGVHDISKLKFKSSKVNSMISSIKSVGLKAISFEVSDAMRLRYPHLKNVNTVSFDSHADLDAFVEKLGWHLVKNAAATRECIPDSPACCCCDQSCDTSPASTTTSSAPPECPSHGFKFSEEYFLLKAIDRAFWLKHIADEKNHAATPAKTGERCGCSFGDPTLVSFAGAGKKKQLSAAAAPVSFASGSYLPLPLPITPSSPPTSSNNYTTGNKRSKSILTLAKVDMDSSISPTGDIPNYFAEQIDDTVKR